MTSKNNDNLDRIENLSSTFSNLQNLILTTAAEATTDGSQAIIIKNISNDTLLKLEMFILIFNDDDENIYKSSIVLRKRENLEFLSTSNIQPITEAQPNWTVNFINNNQNLGIITNTNSDPVKIKILFNEYSVKTK